MSDIGSIAAAGVTTIGTLAVVGTVAKVAGGMAKTSRGLPKPAKHNYRAFSGSHHRRSPSRTGRKKSGYSVFG